MALCHCRGQMLAWDWSSKKQTERMLWGFERWPEECGLLFMWLHDHSQINYWGIGEYEQACKKDFEPLLKGEEYFASDIKSGA